MAGGVAGEKRGLVVELDLEDDAVPAGRRTTSEVVLPAEGRGDRRLEVGAAVEAEPHASKLLAEDHDFAAEADDLLGPQDQRLDGSVLRHMLFLTKLVRQALLAKEAESLEDDLETEINVDLGGGIETRGEPELVDSNDRISHASSRKRWACQCGLDECRERRWCGPILKENHCFVNGPLGILYRE